MKTNLQKARYKFAKALSKKDLAYEELKEAIQSHIKSVGIKKDSVLENTTEVINDALIKHKNIC